MGDRVAPSRNGPDRIPDKALHAAALAIHRLALDDPSRISPSFSPHTTREQYAEAALSAALDVCPVLGLTEEELKALRASIPDWMAQAGTPWTAILRKFDAALRSLSAEERGEA